MCVRDETACHVCVPLYSLEKRITAVRREIESELSLLSSVAETRFHKKLQKFKFFKLSYRVTVEIATVSSFISFLRLSILDEQRVIGV